MGAKSVPTTISPPLRSRFARVPDGLALHALDWGPESPEAVVCLAGISRNALDFLALAEALAADGRRVFAPDYRGRGESDWDGERRYAIPVEVADVVAQLDEAGIRRAVLVGTSRGGLNAMVLAPTRRDLVAGIVLNDIGPVIDNSGLVRISRNLGSQAAPADYAAAAAAIKASQAAQFPALGDPDWDAWARFVFRQTDAGLARRYDPAVTRLFDGVAAGQPSPENWPSFDALDGIPLMSIRGSTSDLFSAATQAEMARRRPDMDVLVVPGQGHAPLLRDVPTVAAIRAFVDRHLSAPR
ncbi:MAG: alpha/beta hydrolase [Hyphomicrobiales bacterium]|nr:alpha/beta hydrolase [Hyphomicrobiales bacterium]MDE2016700.1 alpha/beta hydrolase [Hyphomicrobiales bacterium]